MQRAKGVTGQNTVLIILNSRPIERYLKSKDVVWRKISSACWGSCATFEREGSGSATPSAYAALCTHGTCRQSQRRLRCPGVILEGTGVPGPQRCLNQTPSKGREAFAHHLPQEELPPKTHHTPSETEETLTKTGRHRHMRGEGGEKRKRESQCTQQQGERKVREEGKQSQKSSLGKRINWEVR